MTVKGAALAPFGGPPHSQEPSRAVSSALYASMIRSAWTRSFGVQRKDSLALVEFSSPQSSPVPTFLT